MVNNQLYRLRKSKSTTTQILNFHEDGDDDDDDDDDDENEIWEDVSDNGFAEWSIFDILNDGNII